MVRCDWHLFYCSNYRQRRPRQAERIARPAASRLRTANPRLRTGPSAPVFAPPRSRETRRIAALLSEQIARETEQRLRRSQSFNCTPPTLRRCNQVKRDMLKCSRYLSGEFQAFSRKRTRLVDVHLHVWHCAPAWIRFQYSPGLYTCRV